MSVQHRMIISKFKIDQIKYANRPQLKLADATLHIWFEPLQQKYGKIINRYTDHRGV